VWIRAATKERKRRKLAEKWKYKATVEEVEYEEEFVRRGGTMVEDDGILEEIVEEVFIRQAEKEEEAMPDLCQDSDEDEDDILNYYVRRAEKSLEEMVPRRFRRWMKVFKRRHQNECRGGSHGIMQSK